MTIVPCKVLLSDGRTCVTPTDPASLSELLNYGSPTGIYVISTREHGTNLVLVYDPLARIFRDYATFQLDDGRYGFGEYFISKVNATGAYQSLDRHDLTEAKVWQKAHHVCATEPVPDTDFTAVRVSALDVEIVRDYLTHIDADGNLDLYVDLATEVNELRSEVSCVCQAIGSAGESQVLRIRNSQVYMLKDYFEEVLKEGPASGLDGPTVRALLERITRPLSGRCDDRDVINERLLAQPSIQAATRADLPEWPANTCEACGSFGRSSDTPCSTLFTCAACLHLLRGCQSEALNGPRTICDACAETGVPGELVATFTGRGPQTPTE